MSSHVIIIIIIIIIIRYLTWPDLTWPHPTYTGQSLATEGALSSVLSTRCPPSVFLVCILDFNWWRETDKELKISILLKFWVQLRTIFTRQKLNISLEKIRIIVELSLTTQYSYLQQSYLYDVTGDWENWIKFQINNTQIETLICQPWKGWNKIPSPLSLPLSVSDKICEILTCEFYLQKTLLIRAPSRLEFEMCEVCLIVSLYSCF